MIHPMPREATATPQQIGLYDLIYKIAEGGMGAVYKARNQTTGEIVAVKIIPSETAKNPILMKRFEQEFKAASLLDHPNIVKAIEYCSTGPNPFLVMEFVDGESLGQRVERDGAVEERLAIHYITQVCDGLHRAHKQGIIHRDVKPDNIIVTAEGVAKLTDMGLVKDVEGELNLTRTGRGLGTPHFMAPEQFRNAKNADVKCDVYSLGATLYMMVTGEVPFSKTSPLECWLKKTKNEYPAPRVVNPKLSERTAWAIQRAMSADPKERPASCREFVEDLTGQPWRTRANPGSGAVPQVSTANPNAVSANDLWYLVYKGATGEQYTVKGTTESIRQNVKAGYLGEPSSVYVCRTKTGQFLALRSVPEFRDLVVSAAPVDALPTNTRPPIGSGDSPFPLSDPRSVTPINRMPTPQTVPPRDRVPAEQPAPHQKHTTDLIPIAVVGFTILAAIIGALIWTR